MEEQTQPKPWEHNGTDEIVCPHCGYVHGDSWEYADKDDAETCECDGCGKLFEWERNITVTYDTKPPNA